MQPGPLTGCFEFDVAFASPRYTRVGKLPEQTSQRMSDHDQTL